MSPQSKTLLIAAVIVILSKLLPYGSLLLYPISLLSTWAHEMGHGIVAILTGGKFIELKIFYDTTGLAVTEPEMGVIGKVLIYNSGYLTTATLGFFLLKFRFESEISSAIFLLIAGSIIFSQFFWVKELESHLLCIFLFSLNMAFNKFF